MLGLSRLRIGLLSSSALSIGGGGSFSPLSLFASGEQGAWYDPSDLTTMFQDTAGTTPVTATGQTVGLLLDKSKGLVLGPELVTNGDFSSPTGWTLGTGWSIAGGVAVATAVASFAGIFQNIGVSANKTYRVSVSVTVTSGTVAIGLGNSGENIWLTTSTSGTYTQLVTVGAGTVGTSVYARGNSSLTGTIDNISVKELPGNHATQATAASRPIYGIEPFGGRRNLLVRTEEFDNAVWEKTSASVSGAAITLTSAGSRLSQYFSTSPAGITYTARVVVSGTGTVIFGLMTNGYVTRASQTITLSSMPTAYTVTGAYNVGDTLLGVTFLASGGAATVTLAQAQLETGSTATPYQRVTDQWNVTQAGVPSVSYLSFDGTDDFLLTGTITPGIDKAQVFAGVRKLSDAATNCLLSFGNPFGGTDGSLNIDTSNTSERLRIVARGTVQSIATTTNAAYAAPATAFYTTLLDIAGDNVTGRWNGSVALSSSGDLGTGNFSAQAAYIGRFNGTSSPLNGRIYQMIVRFGANLSAATITQTESYTAGETGIYTVEQLIRLNTLNASGVSYNAYAAADSNGNNYPVTNTVLAANGTPYSVL